ncbi:DNA alkylation repair protein [Pedobacter caeni]|uniref:3-methyladenine DNA glycosylase AlkD n=1 Tax=Pedobacter caeni TaxID=288992 RepID=A0A1M4WDR1_9SPHI|nr:DNA alkylation repair protein [Pedobacter caeni]SHE79379.1 3-methyladenine DNA glycosylase AlkD [Pedobacter caeni]
MERINSKETIKSIVLQLKTLLDEKGLDAFITVLHQELLKKKVRFPLLEYAAREMAMFIPEPDQLLITDHIIRLKEIGSQVLAGIILQQRLSVDFERSIAKACEYIRFGDQWYVCDIIGERILGYALLTTPEKTIPVLRQLAIHEDKWIVRTVGVAAHYAVKKELDPVFVTPVFDLLLSLAGTKDFHTKKGIGWGAKTIARFHPDIIALYDLKIASTDTKQWFRTKIRIGLGRSRKK